MIREERNIATNLILTILTCGIYGIIWFIQMTDDARELSRDDSLPSGGMVFLLSIVTCGIYTFYWAYKMGKLIEQAQRNYGMPTKDNSTLYLVLEILTYVTAVSGIVSYCLIQNELNEITRVHNAMLSNQNQGQAQM